MLHAMPRQKEPVSEFGARLIATRKARGMTQIDLANAIDSTQRAISYYECYGGNPDLPVVVQLARALGVTTDELLGAKPPPRIDSPASDPDAKRYWRRFLQLSELPEKDQRAVFRTIDTMMRALRAEQATAAAKKRKAG